MFQGKEETCLISAVLSLLMGISTLGCSDEDDSKDADSVEASGSSIRSQWWGQASFSMSVEDGITVLTDPIASMGFSAPTIEPEVVTVSHEHPDHNAVESVSGEFETLRGVGEHSAEGIDFLGVATFHDDAGGSQRGDNTVFVWEMEGIRFAHLGDLGHLLTDEQIDKIDDVDVLMVPIGGGPTIDGPTAVQVAEQLSAQLILPMHYSIGGMAGFLQGPESFLEAVPDDWTVDEPEESSISISSDDFSDGEIRVVLLSLE